MQGPISVHEVDRMIVEYVDHALASGSCATVEAAAGAFAAQHGAHEHKVLAIYRRHVPVVPDTLPGWLTGRTDLDAIGGP